MQIKINGRMRQVEPGTTLAGLLAELGLEGKRVAVEHNGRILGAAEDREGIALADGDTLEVVRLVGGGLP